MSSSLFNNMNPQYNSMNNSLNNTSFLQFMNNFNTFKNNFQGDPKAQVQALLNSGQMTQEQFKQISQMANQFYSMISK